MGVETARRGTASVRHHPRPRREQLAVGS